MAGEKLRGESLALRVAAAGPIAPAKAVALVLTVARAVVQERAAGQKPGLTTASRVRIVGEGDAAAAELVLGTDDPVPAVYRAPEVHAGGDEEADPAHVWALALTAWVALTGRLPFPGGEEAAAAADVPAPLGVEGADEAIETALRKALATDPAARTATVGDLAQALAGWLESRGAAVPDVVAAVEYAKAPTEASHAGPPPLPEWARRTSGSVPPPAPGFDVPVIAADPGASAALAPQALPAAAAGAAEAGRGPSRSLLLAAAGVALMAIAFLAFHKYRERPRSVPAGAPSQVPTASLELAPVPIGDDTDRDGCLLGYFPQGAVPDAKALEPVCTEADARKAAAAIEDALGRAAGGASASPATQAKAEWASMGPFRMAAVALVRGDCCSSSKPLEAPAPPGTCPPLGDALAGVGAAARKATDLDVKIGKYKDALACYGKAGAEGFKGSEAPKPAEEAALRKLGERGKAPR